ncbi:glucosamine-6-phosphate deaminase [Staphylococcus aureus]|uniref:glucosamine-6-phosphate deaminase n=1 Tax=Staphylococcus aureus TaxID=1280 RepID=UPI00190C29A0|nr:glucosamine-6-phosphate deaminase [Staphylococcus aureus]MBK3966700.1 glucosamine-6-phosphate deaminase [Staphylococcus aureus]
MKVLNLGSKKQASFYVACELYKEMAFNQHCKLGLATGGTMTDLYEQLVKLLNKNQLNVDNVSTFNLDEYVGLTASHPQSYHYYMDDMLFKQYPYFNRKNIHIPNGDADDMNAEASKNNDVLEQQGQRDIQILGIGENGHIGFNEPGTPFDSVTHIVDLTESTIKANSRYFKNEDDVPKQAISMGLANILQAKRIILLAFGEKKRAAITHLLNQEISVDVPATLLHKHPNVEIYLDDEACPKNVAKIHVDEMD